ncbi:MAG TPA: AAA family ATPase, partial [Myxococcota bacterium]
ATATLRAAEAVLEEAAAAARAAEERERAAREAATEAAARQREAEHAVRLAEQARETARRTAARHAADLAQEESAQQRARAELAEIEATLARAREDAEQLRAVERAAGAQVRAAEEAVTQANAELATARTAGAVAAAEARAARERAARATAELERVTAEQQRAGAEAATAADTARATAAVRDRLAARLAEVEAELTPLAAAETARRAELADLAATLAALDEALHTHQQAVRAADARCHEATLAHARAADALAALHRERAALCAELGVADLGEPDGTVPSHGALFPAGAEPPAAASAGSLPPRELDALRRQLAACQRELRALGAVDPAALEEYRAVAARAEFVQRQIADLEAAAAALRAGMAELQQRMRQRFQETFADVNAAFAECFQTLFGGGRAHLALAETDDVLSAGIEVIAQPPGKRATTLHALSGGERALTAVALLFALLRVQPSPFCVLDEVDAALDEANVRRFAALLRAQAARTQFLVVTHNRTTMEAADTLYGVTMVDNAVSQVVAVRLADLPAATTNGVVH